MTVTLAQPTYKEVIVIKRVCPNCGLRQYSAAAEQPWTCDECGKVMTAEDNQPIGGEMREEKRGELWPRGRDDYFNPRSRRATCMRNLMHS